MRTTILKWLILTILLAYVACAAVWARTEADRRVCTGVTIEVADNNSVEAVTPGSVRKELAKYPRKIKGELLSNINTKNIEEFLSSYSNFENVDCSFSSAGTLGIRIVPMIPEIRIFENGSSYYINKDGKRIDSKANFFVDVPVVTGNFSQKFTPRHILPVVRFIQADPLLSDLVGMVEVRSPEDIILVPRIYGHVVNLGDTTRLSEKRDAIVAMYRKVIPYKGWETYDTISVKFRGQVVASRRDKTLKGHSVVYDEDEDPEEATLPEVLDSATTI